MPDLGSFLQSQLYAPKSKMPFRERVKRVFARDSSGANSPFDKKNNSSRQSINHQYYKPNEPMPRAKYRRPVEPEHKAVLESYSFGQTLIRKSRSIRSLASMYSPMGSRLMSRNASRNSSRAPSRAPSRGPSRGPSRQGSVSGGTPMKPPFQRGKSHIGQVVENVDELEDFANVGGPSRLATRPPSPSRSGARSGEARSGAMSGAMSPTRNGHLSAKPGFGSARDSAQTEGDYTLHRRGRAETAHDHIPFSEAELHNALLRKTNSRGQSRGPVHIEFTEDSPTK